MSNRETDTRVIRKSYRAPGVYYETLAIREASAEFCTGVPVFVGFAQFLSDKKDAFGIRHLTRWQQFGQIYETLPHHYLGYAVRGFFENGGKHCVVVPLQSDLGNPIAMSEALIHVFKSGGVLEDNNFGDIDIDLVCVPDAMVEAIKKIGRSAILDIQSAVLGHCHRMGDRFAILDGFEFDADNAAEADRPIDRIESIRSHWQALPPEHGALYYPWISVEFRPEPASVGSRLTTMPCARHKRNTTSNRSMTDTYATHEPCRPLYIPPCGHVAGIYSRTDSQVGVHKAPANQILEDVLGLEIDFRENEQAELNDSGINCLRSFPGRGICVWGARTLSGQPHWAYVNVRRLFLTLARWLKMNMSDLVYEINDQHLWERVRERLIDYCQNLFERGALVGNSPGEAFFVKCDTETNPPESRELGYVVADVGLAPVIPAEFIMVRITQRAGTIAVTGLEV